MRPFLPAAMTLCAVLCGGGWTAKPTASPTPPPAPSGPAAPPRLSAPIPFPKLSVIPAHAAILYLNPPSGVVCKILNVWPKGRDVRALDRMDVQTLRQPLGHPLVQTLRQPQLAPQVPLPHQP
jgi:hypothetical protein